MARMRTINESVKMIKDNDPDSAITYNFIRTLCKSQKITCFTIGRKVILDFDDLLQTIRYGVDLNDGFDISKAIRPSTRRTTNGNGN